jgi:ribonuclease P protein component
MPGSEASCRRLLKRSEFLRAARGNRAGRSAFLLQAVDRSPAEPGIGFTVTKKTGNSPERNRIRRRLREAARACQAGFLPRHDYVLIGRREALSVPFAGWSPISIPPSPRFIRRSHASRAPGPRDDA